MSSARFQDRPPSAMSDDAVETALASRLSHEGGVAAADVGVAVRHGIVVLRGRVANEAARAQIVGIARQVPGARGVVDLLRVPASAAEAVAPPNGSGPAPAGAAADRQVRWAVEDAMFYDPRVGAFAPNVEVRDGVATLTGSVASPEAKQAAVEDARNARGVQKVDDRLEVRQGGAPSR